MNKKLVGSLLLVYVVLLVVGNIVDSDAMWVCFDIYGIVISSLAAYRLLKD